MPDKDKGKLSLRKGGTVKRKPGYAHGGAVKKRKMGYAHGGAVKKPSK